MALRFRGWVEEEEEEEDLRDFSDWTPSLPQETFFSPDDEDLFVINLENEEAFLEEHQAPAKEIQLHHLSQYAQYYAYQYISSLQVLEVCESVNKRLIAYPAPFRDNFQGKFLYLQYVYLFLSNSLLGQYQGLSSDQLSLAFQKNAVFLPQIVRTYIMQMQSIAKGGETRKNTCRKRNLKVGAILYSYYLESKRNSDLSDTKAKRSAIDKFLCDYQYPAPLSAEDKKKPEKIEAYERQKKRAEEYKGGNSKRTLQKYLREYMKTLLLVPRERQD